MPRIGGLKLVIMILAGIFFWEFELLLLVLIALVYMLLKVALARGRRTTTWVPELVFAVLGAIALVGGYFFWLFFLVQWE
ncbi:MAG: hypothetical protein WBG93_04265 [Thermoanaerobaculia bacterium]